MGSRPKVFIASSSEGLDVTKAVRGLLLEELNDKAEIAPWTREFALSATYIEALEQAAREADFAILVLTPDDLTTSRESDKLAPRDNVIFELGLFIGSIGRERCFLIHEQRPDLKLPTDLLGVNAATFKRLADRDLKGALDAQAFRIAERITKLRGRHKPNAQTLKDQADIRNFSAQLIGAWWERITVEGRNSLSFFQIEFDEVFNSVQLRGRSYDAEGNPSARWKSLIVRILKNENKIQYHWEGWYPATPTERFHGFGEIEFEGPSDPGEPPGRGTGKFWDIDEGHPEKTVVKSTELRRILDKADIGIMTEGREKDMKVVVLKVSNEW